MKKFMIFNSSHDYEGGPFDFDKSFDNLDEALSYGQNNVYFSSMSLPSDIIIRLAEFDCETNKMKYLGKLNIPDTEQDITGKLEWILK